jgi:hypothetical protein
MNAQQRSLVLLKPRVTWSNWIRQNCCQCNLADVDEEDSARRDLEDAIWLLVLPSVAAKFADLVDEKS